MFPLQVGQDGRLEWTRLGTFAGSELTFVRELLQGEDIAHHEELLLGHGAAAPVAFWVMSVQRTRVAVLLAAAQAQAEAGAHRESAVLAAENERAEAAAAREAAADARAAAAAERKAARNAAKAEARRLNRERSRGRRQQSKALERSRSDRGVHIVGGLLAAIILLLAGIVFIGERYGTRRPTPGHDGKPIACHGRYQVICF